jgi:hypothetical protein
MVSSFSRLDRPVLGVLALCLAGACGIHIRDLWQHGWLPYRFAPFALNVYWTSLTFFDALAAGLLFFRPRAGLTLALLIIVSDVAINLFARFYLRLHLQPLALSLQVLFLLAVLAVTLHARRVGAAT